jgi:hypothetical protein
VDTPHRTLTILDPTSLLGREVTDAVARAFPDVRRALFHTDTEPEHQIAEMAGAAALVPPLLELDELEGSAAVVVTALPPPALGDRLIAWLRSRPSIALLDCTQPGLAQGEASSVTDAVPREPRGLPWFHLVDPSLAAPARWLRALLPLEPEGFSATLLSPVSRFGAAAVDELASQATARLSGKPTRRPVHLPEVLAFDLAPAGSERLATIEAQLAELFPAVERVLHLVDIGVFHGNLATVVLRCAHEASLERARTLLRATPGLRLARRGEVLTATRLVESDRVICGDLRVRGRWVSAWVFADGLHVGGADAVLEVLASLSAA